MKNLRIWLLVAGVFIVIGATGSDKAEKRIAAREALAKPAVVAPIAQETCEHTAFKWQGDASVGVVVLPERTLVSITPSYNKEWARGVDAVTPLGNTIDMINVERKFETFQFLTAEEGEYTLYFKRDVENDLDLPEWNTPQVCYTLSN